MAVNAPEPHDNAQDLIERHEHAPRSDAEWAAALRYYGNDRRLGHPSLEKCSLPPIDVPADQPPGKAAKRSQLLIHHEIDDDADDADNTQDLDSDLSDATAQRREDWQRTRHQYGFGSWGGDVHVLSGTAADTPVEKVNNRPTSPADPSQPPSGNLKPNPVDNLAFTQLTQNDAIFAAYETPHEFVESVRLPRSINPDEGNLLCQESERGRLRAFYNAQGWLPPPNPSRDTRLRRSRAIRRLGLNDSSDNEERLAVISKYVELAQLMFGADGAAVAVLRGDTEDIYPAGRVDSRCTFPLTDSLSGHVVLNPEGRCFVIADLEHDWRFQHNPNRLRSFDDQRFFAAAPLRYHRSSGDFIDFGTLCISDTHCRSTFSAREQGILLRLANMLVYQLATLQSEIVAKRSSHMYESSINFLRRSLIPDNMKSGHDVAAAEKTKEKRSPSVSKPEDRRKRANKNRPPPVDIPRPTMKPSSTLAVPGDNPGGPLSPAASELSAVLTPQHTPGGTTIRPPLVRATKSGPRDSQRAKRKDVRNENAMFDDAADTLRGILRADGVCMVDLHEYQLYIRKGGSRKDDQSPQTKESIVGDFLQGKEWPRNVEPVVKHVPRAEPYNIEVMGSSGAVFDFDQPNAIETMTEFIKEYFTTRHFWWDNVDGDDDLARRLMCFLPHKSQTLLASVFLTHSGTLRYGTFIAWERPPASFDDSSRLALPFVWIIGAALLSALAVTRIRNVEESQITYSNLQAHELRTPLHQILAITQLLRSSMSDLAEGASFQAGPRGCLTTLEQVRDLLPFLDAIDTSGKTLHGIVDNILTFLDLTASDNRWESARAKHPIFGQRSSASQTFGSMMEELVHEAYEEHCRSRIGGGQPLGHIETVFEIIPKGLKDIVTEDSGGALRRALGRLINNAYRFIDGPGCVEIYVDDVKSMLPPEGYEDLSNTRRIAIHVIDNGRGMTHEFVNQKLGEPWAKEDLYATGSGLSVHLAFRIVDLMGGRMTISSAPGDGTAVSIEVPVPCRPQLSPADVLDPPRRKVALMGFSNTVKNERCGLERLGASLERQYQTLGCEIVSPDEAELVVVDGDYASEPEAISILENVSACSIVLLESDSPPPSPTRAAVEPTSPRTRRMMKPITPALVLSTLEDVPRCQEVEALRGDGALRPRFEAEAGGDKDAQGLMSSWKAPRGVCVEEAVASLCLGDYFSSRSRANRLPSSTSSTSHLTPPLEDRQSDSPSTPYMAASTVASTNATTPHESPDLVAPTTDVKVKVLVVEDNVINRKILVKILSTIEGDGAGLEIVEAGDGEHAVELFRGFDAPAIVLLDINMPRMDGYTAAVEMRLIEKRKRGDNGEMDDRNGGYNTPMDRSQIFAVTALAGEDEKRRGLVECGMDRWLTKPCPKATLQRVVEDARRQLMLQSIG